MDWFHRLDPLIVNTSTESAVPQLSIIQSSVDRATELLERYMNRSGANDYEPDRRDLDDLERAKSLLQEHVEEVAPQFETLTLHSKVCATLADAMALSDSSGKGSQETIKGLFDTALTSMNLAISINPESAESFAYRANLWLIANVCGSHRLSPMFAINDGVFDPPNGLMSVDVKKWNSHALWQSLQDIQKSVSIRPAPETLARQALLLVLRAIVAHRDGRFPGVEQDIDWEGHDGEVLFIEPIPIIERAIDLSDSPLQKVNLLLQRAWTRAGFGCVRAPVRRTSIMKDLRDNRPHSPWPESRCETFEFVNAFGDLYRDTCWSWGDAIADLDRADRTLKEWAWAGSPRSTHLKHGFTNPNHARANDPYFRTLKDVIHRKRRCFAFELPSSTLTRVKEMS